MQLSVKQVKTFCCGHWGG